MTAATAVRGLDALRLEDSDDDFQYEEVEVMRWAAMQSCSWRSGQRFAAMGPTSWPLSCPTFRCTRSDVEDDASEDLDAALRSLQAFTAKVGCAWV